MFFTKSPANVVSKKNINSKAGMEMTDPLPFGCEKLRKRRRNAELTRIPDSLADP